MSGEVRGTGVVQSERAARYHEQAEQFQRLATMETQPRARARLLEIAGQYQELSDIKSRKPSANLLSSRAGNNFAGGMMQKTSAILSVSTGLVGARR